MGRINKWNLNVNSWMVSKSNHCYKNNGQWKSWCGNRTATRKSSIGELYICAMGLDILKFEQTLFYNASYFNLGGVLELCFRGDKPTKARLWQLDCVAKLQHTFQCNWLGKVLGLCNMSSLQYMSNFLFISMTGTKLINTFKCLFCFEAKSVLGLFCLHLNTIAWSSHMTRYTETIGWDLRVYG